AMIRREACPALKMCDFNLNGNAPDTGDVTVLTNYLNLDDYVPSNQSIIAQGVSNRNTGFGQGGSYPWYVKDSFVTPGDQYKIVVRDTSNSDIIDESDNSFSIVVSAPIFLSPTINQSFTIDPNLQIKINATTPGLQLSRYRIHISQNGQSIYESNPAVLDTLPFLFNGSLLRASDNKRLIELLKQGNLTITLEGNLLDSQGRITDAFTPPASRTVKLSFNRSAPKITQPTAGQEINLGKGSILITATHSSSPRAYKVSLSQNGVLKYYSLVTAGGSNLELTLDRNAIYQGRNVFQSLDKGEIELAVSGELFDGYTDEAIRIFKVVPLPPDYDLNDDGDVNSSDLAILQATIVYDMALRKAVDDGSVKPTISSLIAPCVGTSDIAANKNCNYNNDFEISSSKRSKGIRIIDSRDAALMVSSGAYVSGTASATLSSTGAPILISPVVGAHWTSGFPQNVVIKTVPNATGYLIAFIRPNGTMVFENYRDDNKNLCTLVGVFDSSGKKICVATGDSQTYSVPTKFASSITSGPINVGVRALVNNQWTEGTLIPIIIDEVGITAGSQLVSTSTPPPTQQNKVIVVAPQQGDRMNILTGGMVIYFQKFPDATAYRVFIRKDTRFDLGEDSYSPEKDYIFDQTIPIISLTNVAQQNQYAFAVFPPPNVAIGEVVGGFTLSITAYSSAGSSLAKSDTIEFSVRR
ncbi:MAG: hypothetical protein AAB795_02170, partial [Patescibacteria group bacterium]